MRSFRISLQGIGALSRATLLEALRDRILYGVLLFAVGLILFSTILSDLTLGQPLRIVTDLSLSAVSVGGILMALLLGSSSIARELDKRTVYPILAKCTSRPVYLLGKYIGVVGTVWLNAALMAAAATLMVGHFSTGDGFPYPPAAYLAAVALTLLRLALAAAIAVALSAIASTTVSLLASSGLVMAGHFTADLRFFLERSDNPMSQELGRGIRYLLPDFQMLDVLPKLIHGHPILTAELAWSAIYAVGYGSMVLLCAGLVFSRRDMP